MRVFTSTEWRPRTECVCVCLFYLFLQFSWREKEEGKQNACEKDKFSNENNEQKIKCENISNIIGYYIILKHGERDSGNFTHTYTHAEKCHRTRIDHLVIIVEMKSDPYEYDGRFSDHLDI